MRLQCLTQNRQIHDKNDIKNVPEKSENTREPERQLTTDDKDNHEQYTEYRPDSDK